MKIFFPLVLFCCVMITPLVLQAQWERQYPMDKLNDVLDIDLSTEGYGFAAGPDDLILRYDASDKSWEPLPGYGQDWAYEAVDYLEGSEGDVAVVGGQRLIHTLDGGENWDEITGAPQGINTVKMFSSTHLVAVGDEGAFRWENDQWTDLEVPATVFIKGAFILDEQHMWLYTFATDPAIYYTTDGGANWNTNLDIQDIDVVTFYDALNGIASDGRKIYSTTDGGVNWTLVSENIIHNTSNDIAFGASKEVLMAATANADPSLSTDGGLTWTQLQTGLINYRSYSVAALSDTEFFVGNDYTGMAYTNDQGANWSETSGPVRNVINDIHFISRSVGFGVGQRGMLLRTMNGGTDWEEYTFGGRNNLSIHGLEANDLWMGTQQRILHSVDTGTTWTESLILLGSNINDVLAISSNRVLAGSSSGVIYRTLDGGATWDSMYNAGSQIKSIAHIEGQRYMATGFNGLIIRSNDMGETWETITPPEAGLQYEQVFFRGGKGWLVTSSFKKLMWSTEDAGDSWTPITLPVDRNWEGVYFITPDTGIIVSGSTQEGRAYITFNGGQAWSSGYVTKYSFSGVAGVPNPNGTAWIYGYASNIEVLPYCNAIPAISEFAGDLFPCEADTITYSVKAENIDQFTWLFPTGWEILGDGNNDTVHVRIGDNSGNLSISGSNVCGETNPLNFSAGADRLPEVFSVTGDAAPCVQDILIYMASGLDIDTFHWSIPSDWQVIGGGDNETIQVMVGNTTGAVELTGTNHCGSSEFSLPVEPFEAPQVEIMAIDAATLGLNVSGSAYQWFLNGVQIPGATNETFMPVENGSYSVHVLFLPAECSTVSDEFDFLISSISHPSSTPVEIYPVPASDKLTIHQLTSSFTFSITDLSGKLIMSGKDQDSFIDISSLPQGIFMLNLVSEGKLYHARFSKQ